MHAVNCGCRRCSGDAEAAFEAEPFRYESEVFESASEYPLNETEEVELAMELLSVSSEAEMDQFLGKLVKKAWRGIKKVGSFVSKVAKPFAGALKAIAKKALPFVGGALGSLIPIPGVGTAVGSALGGALGKALELETMNLEDQELEMARRFVRIAATAARTAASASDGMDAEVVVNEALTSAARTHLPNLALGARMGGRWVRRGRHIVVLGA